MKRTIGVVMALAVCINPLPLQAGGKKKALTAVDELVAAATKDRPRKSGPGHGPTKKQLPEHVSDDVGVRRAGAPSTNSPRKQRVRDTSWGGDRPLTERKQARVAQLSWHVDHARDREAIRDAAGTYRALNAGDVRIPTLQQAARPVVIELAIVVEKRCAQCGASARKEHLRIVSKQLQSSRPESFTEPHRSMSVDVDHEKGIKVQLQSEGESFAIELSWDALDVVVETLAEAIRSDCSKRRASSNLPARHMEVGSNPNPDSKLCARWPQTTR